MSQIPADGLQWITQGGNFYSNLLNYFLERGKIQVPQQRTGWLQVVVSTCGSQRVIRPVKDTSPLCPSQRSDQMIQLGRIHVAHSNDVQMRRSRGMNGKSRASFRKSRKDNVIWLLAQQDCDLVLVDSKYEERRRLPVEVSQIGAFKGGVRRKRFGFGKIEAERKPALKPWFDGVAIRGNDLRRRICGQDG